MNTFLISYEVPIRLGVFAACLGLMSTWEVLAPRRELQIDKTLRWKNNLLLTLLNSLLIRMVFPAAAVGAAAFAGERGIGLFNIAPLPLPAGILLSVLALDFALYLQHRLFHAVPLLWRLHRMHHADLDVDVTTGTRFHPLEVLLSMLIKFAVILLAGLPALGVLIFEIVLNSASMFNHGNVRVRQDIERIARSIVVTPDMHRVHHSIDRAETNSNFGFCLSWWDRILGTYKAQPASGHQAMTLGIDQFRSPRDLRLDRMLLQPLAAGTRSGEPLQAGR